MSKEGGARPHSTEEEPLSAAISPLMWLAHLGSVFFGKMPKYKNDNSVFSFF